MAYNNDSSEGPSDGEETTTLMFQCKKCPGKLFTLAEKDLHRQMHRDAKNKQQGGGGGSRILGGSGATNIMQGSSNNKPGPKSSKKRRSSPTPSSVTMFEPINSGSVASGDPAPLQTARRTGGVPMRRRDNNNVNYNENGGGHDDDDGGVPDLPPPIQQKIRSNKKIRTDDVTPQKTNGG